MTDAELKQAIEDLDFSSRLLDASSYTFGALAKPWGIGSTLYAQILKDSMEGMKAEVEARKQERN